MAGFNLFGLWRRSNTEPTGKDMSKIIPEGPPSNPREENLADLSKEESVLLPRTKNPQTPGAPSTESKG